MLQRRSRVGLAFAAAVTAAAAAACGGSSSPSPSGGGSTGGAKGTVIMGTTDTIVSADPAGSYDLPSWTIVYNVYQTLLKVPPGTSNIEPDAATCNWHGKTTYVCTLKPGQQFSNGDPVTGADVVFSFKRILKIKNPNGPASLLASMKDVTASGNTVTFTLTGPNATWPYVLTTGAGAIVDQKVFPFDKLLADNKIVGSGPYELTKYTPNQLAEFKPNPHYHGDDVLHNGAFIVRYEQDAATLVSDEQQGQVDIAYRTLSPTQLQALSKSNGVSLVQGKGIEIRYLVFNEKLMSGSNAAQKLAIRKAVAQVIDRSAIVSNVYKGQRTPLFSIVPQGLNGATKAFQSAYGANPNTSAAKAALHAAGVSTPVKLTLWYNTNHYDDGDLATELRRQLNASGLFDVKLQTAEWATYSKAALSDQYAYYLFGWFPDYPDADDYLSPFLPCKTAFLNDHFCNPQIDKLINREEATTDQGQRMQDIGNIQTLVAQGVPFVPLWQGGQIAAVRSGVTGVQSTLDPSYTFRFWLVGKS